MVVGQMEQEIKDEIFKVTQKYKVTVDEAELLKALRYDRDQYKKGYKDGYFSALARTKEMFEEMFEALNEEE